MRNVRAATNRILEMIEEGILDRDYVINACLSYMSESDVADMARCNDIPLDNDNNEDESDPLYEWYDTSSELD